MARWVSQCQTPVLRNFLPGEPLIAARYNQIGVWLVPLTCGHNMCRRGASPRMWSGGVLLWFVALVLCGATGCHSLSTFEYSAMVHHLGSLSVTTVG
jgi:hypothetical protein